MDDMWRGIIAIAIGLFLIVSREAWAHGAMERQKDSFRWLRMKPYRPFDERYRRDLEGVAVLFGCLFILFGILNLTGIM